MGVVPTPRMPEGLEQSFGTARELKMAGGGRHLGPQGQRRVRADEWRGVAAGAVVSGQAALPVPTATLLAPVRDAGRWDDGEAGGA